MNHVHQVFKLNSDIMTACLKIVRQNMVGEVENLNRDFQARMDLNVNPMFIWVDNNQIHGFVKGHRVDENRNTDPNGDCMWGDWLFVEPTWQRRGVGYALAQACEHYCRTHGIWLFSFKTSETIQARAFHTQKCHYDIIDNYHFIMSKKLMPGHGTR